jgi:D-alanine-D-alanine ligase
VRKLRVLILMHEDFVPPEDLAGLSEAEIDRFKTEFDVTVALQDMGHEVRNLGVRDELHPIRDSIEEWKPHIVFNLMEEFQGEAVYDQNVVAFLELLKVPYTGCGTRGLVLARDKALSKKLVAYHRVRAPRFVVFRSGRAIKRPRSLQFPLIVKSLTEEASLGIAKASVVNDDEKLVQRVRFVHERVGTDAIVEQFISGREIYVGVIGNDRLKVFPPQELIVRKQNSDEELIATERVKHDVAYQKKHGVRLTPVPDQPQGLVAKLERLSKRIYRMLELEGYARIDYRLDREDEIYFLEANPNPEIARFEEFASAAESTGLSYESLLQRVLNLGLRR